MRKKDQFPFTGKGFGWQEEYKGYDIIVYVEKNKGITLYVFKDDRTVHTDSRSFGNRDELFQWGRNHIDRVISFESKKSEENAIKKAEYYKTKCKEAAIKALNSSAHFKKIEGEDYVNLLSMFEYELERQFNKVI